MCGGGSPPPQQPLSKEELEADTDNPYENPVSGEETPSWKVDQEKPEEELKIPDKSSGGQTSSDNYQG